jgi:hypothetical protein
VRTPRILIIRYPKASARRMAPWSASPSASPYRSHMVYWAATVRIAIRALERPRQAQPSPPVAGYAPQATVVKECKLAIRPPICASVAEPIFGNHAGGIVRASAICEPTCAKKSIPMFGCGGAFSVVNSWVSAGFCVAISVARVGGGEVGRTKAWASGARPFNTPFI